MTFWSSLRGADLEHDSGGFFSLASVFTHALTAALGLAPSQKGVVEGSSMLSGFLFCDLSKCLFAPTCCEWIIAVLNQS